MIWIDTEDIIMLHSHLIRKTGGLDGLRDRSLLEAAVAAPLQSFDGNDLYKTDIEKIARLGYGLASNHAFLDGSISMLTIGISLRNTGSFSPCREKETVTITVSWRPSLGG